jgi:3-deoxy-manno-octulosonate cytidylyltransferase (CMP-KDO synthetase)
MTFDTRRGPVLTFAVPILCVIPARLGSSRLPRKPLRLLSGEPLVRAVARRAVEAGVAHRVVVAADHPDVAAAVAGLAVDAVLTDPAHSCGTERVAEAAALADYAWADVILNVQGDEPFFSAAGARAVTALVEDGHPVGTVGATLTPSSALDRNRVKVVVDGDGRALRFARDLPASSAWGCDVTVLQHVGLYAYTRGALVRWVTAPCAPEEREERLEQLRPLSQGIPIAVARLGEPAPHGIDTEQDLFEAERLLDAVSERAHR